MGLSSFFVIYSLIRGCVAALNSHSDAGMEGRTLALATDCARCIYNKLGANSETPPKPSSFVILLLDRYSALLSHRLKSIQYARSTRGRTVAADRFPDDFINFLVPTRSEVQEAIRRLYFLSDEAKAIGVMSTELEVHSLMVGVGFSLWRAVFTAHEKLNRDTNLESSKEFLNKLIATNAVTFQAEQVSWVYGYYINNARLRLATIVELLPKDNRTTLSAALADMRKPAGESDEKELFGAYKNTHALFIMVLDLLEGHLRSRSRTAWPGKPPSYVFG